MPVETAATLDQLNANYPTAVDPLSETDDHLRLIKSALKGTFKNITGVVTATLADLNANIAARLAALEAYASHTLGNTGGQTLNGNLTVTGAFNTGAVLQQGSALVPRGCIMLWNNPATIPNGWAACNGQNGTVDLRDRTVIGHGPTNGSFSTSGLQIVPQGAGAAKVVILVYIMKL